VRWLLAVLVVCLASGGFVVARTRRVAGERAARARALARGSRVLVTSVRHAPEEREIALPATVHGFVETPIYAKIAGYLKTIRVDKGDRVKRGDLLAVLESPELDKQVANMEADYAIKALTARRARLVARAGALSQEEADVAQADATKAKATLEQYRAMQAYERITAPLDGVITARYVDPGTLIPQATTPSNGTPILALATLEPVRVYAYVPQDLTPFVKNGDPAVVTVTQYPRRTFTGSITRHPEALAPDTRTMLIEVDLANSDMALLPGMYGTLRLRVSQPDVARVPDDTLVFREGKIYVPVVRNDRLHLAEVTLGYDDGREVEVLSGIADDDVIALNVGQGVEEGDPVQPVRAEPATPEARRD
jgi:RND family efflux transporter MFP subunit